MKRVCFIADCKNHVNARGLCHRHYAWARRRNKWPKRAATKTQPTPAARVCRVCGKMVYAKGLCELHYSRARKGVAFDRPLRGTFDPIVNGYAKRWNGTRYQAVHRLTMEKKLGRKLRKHETVHHKNGKRADNRPSNLELWSRGHPYGQRVKDLLKFARWVLKTYEKEKL